MRADYEQHARVFAGQEAARRGLGIGAVTSVSGVKSLGSPCWAREGFLDWADLASVRPTAKLASALLRRDALGRAPFLEQRLATARIALVGEFQCGNAIGAEMAIVAA